MTGNKWIRQTHRWISMLFTLVCAAIFIALGVGHAPAEWVYYLPLFPLALLVLSGLYLFFWPYMARVHGTRAARSVTTVRS